MRWQMIGLLTLALWAPLCAQQVAFERGFYSFEAIAQALSVGGRQVVCEPTLKQRMALLSLKPRDWEAMRKLLQKGLDLEIVCVDQGKNRWRLQRDRRVVAREKQLRTRLAEMIEARLLGKRPQREPNWSLLLSSLSTEVPAEEIQTWKTWFENFETFRKESEASEDKESGDPESSAGISLREILAKRFAIFAEQLADSGMPDCPMLTRWAREQATLPREEFLRRFGTYFGELMLSLDEERRVQYILLAIAEGVRASPEVLVSAQVQTFLQSRLSLRKAIQRAIEQGEVVQVTVLPSTIGSLIQSISSSREDDAPIIEDYGGPHAFARVLPYTTVLKYQSDLDLDLEVTCWTFLGLDHEPFSLGWSIEIPIDQKGLTELFKEMDSSWYNRYVVATDVHLQLIRNAVCHTPVDLTIRVKTDDGHETILTGGWYFLLDRFAYQLQQEVICEVYPNRDYRDIESERASLAQILLLTEAGGVWRVEQTDGVWIWRNWLAFVDRVPDLPLALVYQLYSSQISDDLMSLGGFRRFVQQTTPSQVRWFAKVSVSPVLFGIAHRFSFKVSEWILFRLLDSIPNWESQLRQKEQLNYALSRVPVFVLRRFVEEISQAGLVAMFPDSMIWEDNAWHVPGISDALKRNLVEVLQRSGQISIQRHGKGIFVDLSLAGQSVLRVALPIRISNQK